MFAIAFGTYSTFEESFGKIFDSEIHVFQNKTQCVQYCNAVWGTVLKVRQNLENELYMQLCGEQGFVEVAKSKEQLVDMEKCLLIETTNYHASSEVDDAVYQASLN